MSRRDSPGAPHDSSHPPARNYTGNSYDKSHIYRSYEGKGSDDGHTSSSYTQDRRWRDQRHPLNDVTDGVYTPTHPRSRNDYTDQSFRSADRDYVKDSYAGRGLSGSSSRYPGPYSRQPGDHHSPPMRPRHNSPPRRPYRDSSPLRPHRDSPYRPHTSVRDQRWAASQDTQSSRDTHPYREHHARDEFHNHAEDMPAYGHVPPARTQAHSSACPVTPGHATRTPQRWSDAPLESRESHVHMGIIAEGVRGRMVGSHGVEDQPVRHTSHHHRADRDRHDNRDELSLHTSTPRAPGSHALPGVPANWTRHDGEDRDKLRDEGAGDALSGRDGGGLRGVSGVERRRGEAEGRAGRTADGYGGDYGHRGEGTLVDTSTTVKNEAKDVVEPLARSSSYTIADTRSYASVAALSTSTSTPTRTTAPADADARGTVAAPVRKATPASLLQRLLGPHARASEESSVDEQAAETVQALPQRAHSPPAVQVSVQPQRQPQALVRQQSQQQPQEHMPSKAPMQVLGAARPNLVAPTTEPVKLPATSPCHRTATQPAPLAAANPTEPVAFPTAPRTSPRALPHPRLTLASNKAPLAVAATAPAPPPHASPAASLELPPVTTPSSSSLPSASTSSPPPASSRSSSSAQIDSAPQRPLTTPTNTHANAHMPQKHPQTHLQLQSQPPTRTQSQPQLSPKPQQPQQPQQCQPPQPRPPGLPESDLVGGYPRPPLSAPAPSPAALPTSASASNAASSRPLLADPPRPSMPSQTPMQPPPHAHPHPHPHPHPHQSPHYHHYQPHHAHAHGHGQPHRTPLHLPPHLRPHVPPHAPTQPALAVPSPHAHAPFAPYLPSHPHIHTHAQSHMHPRAPLHAQGPYRPPAALAPHVAQAPSAPSHGAPVATPAPTSAPAPLPPHVPVPASTPAHPAPSAGPSASLPTAPAPPIGKHPLPSPTSHPAALQRARLPTPTHTSTPTPISAPTPEPAPAPSVRLVPVAPARPPPPLRASPLVSLLDVSAAAAPGAPPLSASLLALIRCTGAHLPPGYMVERSLSLLPGGLRYAAERRVRRANEARRKQQKEQERREEHRRRRSTAKDVSTGAGGGRASPQTASPRVQAGRASPIPHDVSGAAAAPAPQLQAQAQAQAQRDAARLQRTEEHVEGEQSADADSKRKRPSALGAGVTSTTNGTEDATSDTGASPRTAHGTGAAQWSTDDVLAAAARAYPDLFTVDSVKNRDNPGKSETSNNESFTSFFWQSVKDPNVHLPLYRALFPYPSASTAPPACLPLPHASDTAPYDPLAPNTLAAARTLVLDFARARYQALLALQTALPVTLTAITSTSSISSGHTRVTTGSGDIDTAAAMGVLPTVLAADAALCSTANSHAVWTAEADAVARDVRALHRTLPAQTLRLALGTEPGSRIVAAARAHEDALARHLRHVLRSPASVTDAESSHVNVRSRVSMRRQRARQASLLQELRRQYAHTILSSLLAATDITPLVNAQANVQGQPQPSALQSAEGTVPVSALPPPSSSSLSSSSSSTVSHPVAALLSYLAHTPLPGAPRARLLSRQLLAVSLARMHLLARHMPAHTREALLRRVESLCGGVDVLMAAAEDLPKTAKRQMQAQLLIARPDTLFLRMLRARIKTGSGFSLGKDISPGGSFPEMVESAVVAHRRSFRRALGLPAPAQSPDSDTHDVEMSTRPSRLSTVVESFPADTATHAQDAPSLPALPSSTGPPSPSSSFTHSASATGPAASTPRSGSSLSRVPSHAPASVLARSISATHPPSPTHAGLMPASPLMARSALTPLSTTSTASPHACAPRTLRRHAFGHGLSAQHKSVAMDSLGKTRIARINPVSGASEYAEQRPLAQRGYAPAVARDNAATGLAAVRVRLLARVYRRMARSYAVAARGLLSGARDKPSTSTSAAAGLFGLSSPFPALMHTALHGSLPCPPLPAHLPSALAPSQLPGASSLPPLPPHSSSPAASPTHGPAAPPEESSAHANTYCGPSLAALAALRDGAAKGDDDAGAPDAASAASKRALFLQALFGAGSPYAVVLQRVLSPAQLTARMRAILRQSLHRQLRDTGVGAATLAPELFLTRSMRPNAAQTDVDACSLPILASRATGDVVQHMAQLAPRPHASITPAPTTPASALSSEPTDASEPPTPVFSPGEYHEFPIPTVVQSLARALPLNELFCSSMLPLAHVEATLASEPYRRAFPGLPPTDPAWLQLDEMVRARMPTASLRAPAALRVQLAAALLGERAREHDADFAAETTTVPTSASTAASQTDLAADPALQELAVAMVLALCHADVTADVMAPVQGEQDALSHTVKRGRPAREEASYVSSHAHTETPAEAQVQGQVQGQVQVPLHPPMCVGGPSMPSTGGLTLPLALPPKSSSAAFSKRCQRLLRALCGYPHAFLQPRLLPVQTRVFAPAASHAMHSLSFNRALAFTMGKAFSEIDFSGMVAAYRMAHTAEPLGTAADPIPLVDDPTNGDDDGGDGRDDSRDGDSDGSAPCARELAHAVRWWLQTHRHFKRRDSHALHSPIAHGIDNNSDHVNDRGVGEGDSNFSLSVHTVRGALSLLADQVWPTARRTTRPTKTSSGTTPASIAPVTSAAIPAADPSAGSQRPPRLPALTASTHTPRTAAPSVSVMVSLDVDSQRKRKREALDTALARASAGLGSLPSLASLLLAPGEGIALPSHAPAMPLMLLWRLLRAHPHLLLVLQRVQTALLRVTASLSSTLAARTDAGSAEVDGTAERLGLSLREAVRADLTTMPAFDASERTYVSDMTDTSASCAELLPASPPSHPPRTLATLTVVGPRGPVAVRVARRSDGCLLVAVSGADVTDLAALERVAGVVHGQRVKAVVMDSVEHPATDGGTDTGASLPAPPLSRTSAAAGTPPSVAPRASCCCTLSDVPSVAVPADQDEDENGDMALAALSLASPVSPSAHASSAFAASLVALTDGLSPASGATKPCGCYLWSALSSDAGALTPQSTVSIAYRAVSTNVAQRSHGTLVYTHARPSAAHMAATHSFVDLLLAFLPDAPHAHSSAKVQVLSNVTRVAGGKDVATVVSGHNTTIPATAPGPVIDVVPCAVSIPSTRPTALLPASTTSTPATSVSSPLPAPLQDLPWLRPYLSPTLLRDLQRVHVWENERGPRAREAKRRNAQLLEQYQRGLRKFDRKYAHLRPEDRPRRKRLVLPVFFAHLTPTAVLPAVSAYAAQWAAMVRQHVGARYSQLLQHVRVHASTGSQSNSASSGATSIAIVANNVDTPCTLAKTVSQVIFRAETARPDLYTSAHVRDTPADALVRVEVCLWLSTGEFGCNIILCDTTDSATAGHKAPRAGTVTDTQAVGVVDHTRTDTDRALLRAADTQARSAAVVPAQYYAVTVGAAGVTAVPEASVLPRAQPLPSEAALDRVDLRGSTPDFAAYSDLADNDTAAALARAVVPASDANAGDVDGEPTPLATATAYKRADAQLLAPLEPFGYTLPTMDVSTPSTAAGASMSLPEADSSCLLACPDGTISAAPSLLATPLESSDALHPPATDAHGGADEAGELLLWPGGVDPAGLEYYLDPDGNPCYLDADGAVYYHDARGYPYYLCPNGDRMYRTSVESDVVFYSPELDVWYTLDSQRQVLVCDVALATDTSAPLPSGQDTTSAAPATATTLSLASTHAVPESPVPPAVPLDEDTEAQLLAEAWLAHARSTRAFADDEDAHDDNAAVPEAGITQTQMPLICDLMASRPDTDADTEPSKSDASMFACSDTFESLAPDTLTVSSALLELLPVKARKRVTAVTEQHADVDVDGASPPVSSPSLACPPSFSAPSSGPLPAATLTPSSRNPLHTHTHAVGGSSDRDTPLKPQVSHSTTTSTELSTSLSDGTPGDTAPVVIPSRAQVVGLTTAECSALDPLELAQMSLAEHALGKLHTTLKTNLRRVQANLWNAVSITTSLDCLETVEM